LDEFQIRQAGQTPVRPQDRRQAGTNRFAQTVMLAANLAGRAKFCKPLQ
jgi:hypothetical protein